MTDEEYIKRAFELAEGWEYERDDIEPDEIYLSAANGTYWHMDEFSIPIVELPQMFLDALAAQLVRQVDALDEYNFTSGQNLDSYEYHQDNCRFRCSRWLASNSRVGPTRKQTYWLLLPCYRLFRKWPSVPEIV